jgi:hypothetical protein
MSEERLEQRRDHRRETSLPSAFQDIYLNPGHGSEKKKSDGLGGPRPLHSCRNRRGKTNKVAAPPVLYHARAKAEREIALPPFLHTVPRIDADAFVIRRQMPSLGPPGRPSPLSLLRLIPPRPPRSSFLTGGRKRHGETEIRKSRGKVKPMARLKRKGNERRSGEKTNDEFFQVSCASPSTTSSSIELSFQSSLQLSLALLVCYRCVGGI